MKETTRKFKGTKFYAPASSNYFDSVVGYESIEKATDELRNDRKFVVELTVTRVFEREKELKEIENEI